jgi:hypothetical protein
MKMRSFHPLDFWASTGFGVSVKEDELQRMRVAHILWLRS